MLIEDRKAFLIHCISRVKEYEIICIDKTSTLISVEGLKFTDKIRMYTKDIKGFDEKLIMDILPECYI
ncbi:MAG: hypothetical protein PHO65_03770 [Sulfurovum sp.]|nr:hypothetical protein [Sulfurovum sp.]